MSSGGPLRYTAQEGNLRHDETGKQMKRATSIAFLIGLLAALPAKAENFVLDLSWEPSFCATSAGQPKTECAAGLSGSYAERHLVLHGLFQQNSPSICKPSYSKDPPVSCDNYSHPISAADIAALQLPAYMPGVASCLDGHEWSKHGAFMNLPAKDFFAKLVDLLKQANAGKLGKLLTQKAGAQVTAQEVSAAIAADFGPDAIQHGIRLRTNPQGQLTDIMIYLTGDNAAALSVDQSHILNECSAKELPASIALPQ